MDGPKGRRIEHVESIAAPAEAVWAILADLPGWAAWNPLSRVTAGRLALGETLDLSVALPGMKPHPAHPVVTMVDPGRGFRCLTRGAGGLMRAERYYEIAAQGAGCTIRNGEAFAGPIGRLVAALLGRTIAKGMAQMNAALKLRAEQDAAPPDRPAR